MQGLTDIVCVSGGFDPLHGGHLSMFQEAAEKGKLVIILNSDAWLIRKKGFCFLPWEQRAEILGSLRGVYQVVPVNDDDDTVCEALTRLKPKYFVNGGDRRPDNTPEMQVCERLGIDTLWDVGGGKMDSSSNIAKRAWVTREWGQYVTLDEGPGYKVKKLVVYPQHGTSLQRHKFRTEFWSVVAATASVMVGDDTVQTIRMGDPSIVVEPGQTHKLMNHGEEPVIIIEIQTGEYLCEDDIKRFDV